MSELWCAGGSVWLLFSTPLCAQESRGTPVFDSPTQPHPAISFFAPLFFPKVLQDEYRLKQYICSDEFGSLRRAYGDVIAVDAIFSRALMLSWSNLYEALLLSFVCTLEHRNFGLRLPVIGPLLWLPLTSEFVDEFQQRVRSLPSRLYEDTPSDLPGDRDKLQHFFGSAFLTYTFESPEAAERVGMFIEWGEDKFVVDGSLDQRDIRANIQGRNFGIQLLSGASVLPSKFLREADHTLSNERGCVPRRLEDSLSSFMEER